ncbi:MAG: flavodoxin family protein [Collinsella aerofaciens]|nr:flavodoxin family protein [Collinsella aerofaciens]
MNILAINGSPKGRRSNTWRLASAFLGGIAAQEESAHEQPPAIETLNVSDLDIKPCLGCFSCWSKTPGTCRIHDDMRAVIEKILRADIIIWSFPLYYFGLPGPLKNLIDRQLPMSLPFMSAGTESGGHPSRHGGLKLAIARKALGLDSLLAQSVDRQIPDVVIVLDVIDHVEPLCGRHDRILTLKAPVLDGISQNGPSNNPPCADRSGS